MGGHGGGYEAVHGFLTDGRFVDLRRRADRGILLWGDLTDDDVPPGYTKEQVWDILCAVRRQTAIDLPWDTFADKGYAGKGWFALTRALSSALAKINALMADGTALSQRVSDHRGSQPLMTRVYQDVAAAFEFSGRPVGVERIRAAFKGDLAIADETDRLIANFAAMYATDVPEMAAHRISPWSVEHLHNKLFEGVPGPIDPDPESDKGVRRYADSVYADADVTLKTISEMLEWDNDDNPFHPVLRIVHVQWFFWVNRPFDACNALVEVLVRHAACMRLGYSALAYVPLAYLQNAWIDGKISVQRPSAELFAHLAKYKDDFTPFYLVLVRLILDDVERLGELLDRLDERDAELSRAFDDAFFNVRQRTILSNALNNSDQPQKIEPHRRLYRVSYATARKDFLDLEERGYLVRREVGRAFAFLPSSRLLDAYGG